MICFIDVNIIFPKEYDIVLVWFDLILYQYFIHQFYEYYIQ
jgi:hypothetical protein